MNFFQYLFCNQYAATSGNSGDTRRAHINTIIISAVLISLYIILVVVAYGRINPPYLDKLLSLGFVNGKAAGWFFTGLVSVTVLYSVKFFIGRKDWCEKTVEQYKGMRPEEQRLTVKKGARYFFIASLPVIIFIMWALISIF